MYHFTAPSRMRKKYCSILLVFEIESMTFDSTISSWVCVMTTTGKGNAIAKEYIELQVDQMNKGDAVILLGTILCEMDKFKKSRDYFETLKDRSATDVANILFGLDRAHNSLNKFKEALHCFNHTRNICLNDDSPDL